MNELIVCWTPFRTELRQIGVQPIVDPLLVPFGVSVGLVGDGSLVVLPTPERMPGSVSMFA